MSLNVKVHPFFLPLACGLALCSLGSCASRSQAPSAPAVAATASAPRFGSSLEAAFAAQVANPEATETAALPIVTDGARAVLAVENYRKGTTKALVRESTSVTKTAGGGNP
jgi:type IV pilus biogenesis protein CpaD/CtpE